MAYFVCEYIYCFMNTYNTHLWGKQMPLRKKGGERQGNRSSQGECQRISFKKLEANIAKC